MYVLQIYIVIVFIVCITVRYDNSVAFIISCCLSNFESNDVITFMKQCLFRMVSILLDQM
jgi:hypothetical protein